jgi:hypothetical protein
MFIAGIITLAFGLGLAVFYIVQIKGLRRDETRRKENQWHDPQTGLRANKDEVNDIMWDTYIRRAKVVAPSSTSSVMKAPATMASPPAPAPTERHGYPIIPVGALQTSPPTGLPYTLIGAAWSTVTNNWYYAHYTSSGNLAIRNGRTDGPLTPDYISRMEEKRVNVDPLAGPEWEDA